MLKKNLTLATNTFAVCAVAFVAFLLLVPPAAADIFNIEAGTSCPGSVGGAYAM